MGNLTTSVKQLLEMWFFAATLPLLLPREKGQRSYNFHLSVLKFN